MRQKCVKMGLVLLGKEERQKCVRHPSKLRQKCVKNARNTFGPSKLRLPWVSKRGIRDGMSRTPGGVQKVCAKKKTRIFRSLFFHLVRQNYWDPSFPLENTKCPRPENPGKLLKNYNLGHPEPVLKITETLLKRVIF